MGNLRNVRKKTLGCRERLRVLRRGSEKLIGPKLVREMRAKKFVEAKREKIEEVKQEVRTSGVYCEKSQGNEEKGVGGKGGLAGT